MNKISLLSFLLFPNYETASGFLIYTFILLFFLAILYSVYAFLRIQAVLDAGIAPRMIELLSSPASIIPALRCVGNIVTGDDVQTQELVNFNLLPALVPLFAHSKKSVRKEAFWTLSNITAGSSKQIQAVIDAGVFPIIITVLSLRGVGEDLEIEREAGSKINKCW